MDLLQCHARLFQCRYNLVAGLLWTSSSSNQKKINNQYWADGDDRETPHCESSLRILHPSFILYTLERRKVGEEKRYIQLFSLSFGLPDNMTSVIGVRPNSTPPVNKEKKSLPSTRAKKTQMEGMRRIFYENRLQFARGDTGRREGETW